MTLAKAFVTGTVKKAPEKRFTQNNMAIADFVVSVDDAQDTLLRVILFGQQAETVSATIAQNDRVAIEGALQINTFKQPNGKDKKVFEISASTVEKISGSVQATLQSSSENIVSFNSQDEMGDDLIDPDGIPF